MDAILSQDFGTWGIILTIFVVGFSAIAVPVVVWRLMKQGMAQAEAEARKGGAGKA